MVFPGQTCTCFLNDSFGCVVAVTVLCLCLTVPLFVLWTVIVVFPGHTCSCLLNDSLGIKLKIVILLELITDIPFYRNSLICVYVPWLFLKQFNKQFIVIGS